MDRILPKTFQFWLQNEKNLEINHSNISDDFLTEIPMEWKNFDTIVCKPINVDVTKLSKMIKRGWRNLINDPGIFLIKKNKLLNYILTCIMVMDYWRKLSKR